MTWLFPILLSGIVATSGTVATSGVNTTVYPVTSPANWESSFLAVWYLEEGTTSTRVNSAGSSTCGGTGSNCNLTRSGNTTNDSTSGHFKQGSFSNVFDGTGDYLSCADATCSALDVSSSVSFGCWSFTDIAGAYDGAVIAKHDGTNGYELEYDVGLEVGFTGKIRCTIGSTGATYTTGTLIADFTIIGHTVCVFDDSANTLNLYYNASSVASASPSSISTTSEDFKIGSSGNVGDFDGNADECFVYNGVLSAASICRICSCGVDGSLCTCNSGTDAFLTTGRNTTSCGSCSLPSSCSGSPT